MMQPGRTPNNSGQITGRSSSLQPPLLEEQGTSQVHEVLTIHLPSEVTTQEIDL